MSKAIAVALLATLTLTARLAAAEPDVPEHKDPGTAVMLSAGGTLLSVGVLLVGVDTRNSTLAVAGALSSLITPAAGEIYAGKLFTPGIGLRLAGAGLAVVGVGEALNCAFTTAPCDRNERLVSGLLIGGAVSYASGVVLDIALAGSAAEDFNRKHDLHIAPIASRTATAGQTFGVGLSGSF